MEFNKIILECNHKIRVCLIMEILHYRESVIKYALTEYHPAVSQLVTLWNELNDYEVKYLIDKYGSFNTYALLHL